MISARDFVNKTIAEAKSLGLNCIILADGISGHTGTIERILNPCNYVPVPMTMRDIYKYIMSASRDDTGMHVISEGNTSTPFIGLHIYSNRSQVNICVGKTRDDSVSVGDIIFNAQDDEVQFIKVSEAGTANYDDPWYTSMNTKLEHVNWRYIFNDDAEWVYQLFSDLIRGQEPNEIVARLMTIPENKDRIFTFIDLWHFINDLVQPGSRVTFPEHDSIAGAAWIFVRMTDPAIIDLHHRKTLYDGLGTRCCRFTFEDAKDQEWLITCQVDNCNVLGELIESRSPLMVCGDCRITPTDQNVYQAGDPLLNFSTSWHYALGLPNNRGIKIRKKLDDILRGYYHK